MLFQQQATVNLATGKSHTVSVENLLFLLLSNT